MAQLKDNNALSLAFYQACSIVVGQVIYVNLSTYMLYAWWL